MNLDDISLTKLLTDLESDRVERKESLKGDAPNKLRQAICAFANDLPNNRSVGIAFIGVDDSGKHKGLLITDELLLQLADMKSDGKIVPPPSMTVEKRNLNGHDVAVITVLPSAAPPVRYEGRIWIRTGPRRDLASKQDEQILNEKRRHNDLPFDIQPLPSSSIEDLDRLYYESEYLSATVARDVLDANDRTYEQRLSSSKLISATNETTPTVLGHLVVGIRTRDFLPGAYVQFLRLRGNDLASDIVDEQNIDGRLADVSRQLDEKLRAHNSISVDIKSADKEERRADYPIVALQQFVRNALLHRSYENTNAPVKVNWFSDRIEVWSPGGPFGAVTKATFARPGYADYRNPHIAEAMKGLGLVQRFGVGIQTAIAELRRNGNPDPEFQVEDSAINVIVGKA
jgi:ATP-dependent DNA helicase RecG